MDDIFNKSIDILDGIGEKNLKLYKKLGVETIQDLIELYPRRYFDYSDYKKISEVAIGETVCVKATLVKKDSPRITSGNKIIYRALASDDTGNIQVLFFNNKYPLLYAKENLEYIFYGKISKAGTNMQIVVSNMIPDSDIYKLKPVYPQTAGLNSYAIFKDVKQAYTLVHEHIKDILPDELRLKYKLCHKNFAIKSMHFPLNNVEINISKIRLGYEELLILQLALFRLKRGRKIKFSSKIRETDMDKFYSILDFNLTNDQKKAINECIEDIHSGYVMNRLVQGDVGSGKTIVSAAIAYYILQNGLQVAIMAPTEILAKQHYETFCKIFDKFNIRCELLIGSLTAKQKKEAYARIETGDAGLVIGTHAVISDKVKFDNLALVVTDEQHRFGVSQRTKLAQKGENTHMLVMSATPIPRTLALILYGDLDISLIKELPPGRQKIKTYFINSKVRDRALNFIYKIVQDGGQAYVVCPLVEEGEDESTISLKSVQAYIDELKKTVLGKCSMDILHGKMKTKEKDIIMQRFKNNEISVLVSTTVVEVGVDVPNAQIMLIENAERFGLSQLHQLRGRVGRGEKQSHCILVSDSRGEVAVRRLNIMTKTDDGFKLAEEDLQIRGPGDFFGSRQHGMPNLKIADMLTDSDLLKKATDTAKEIMKTDPEMKNEKYKDLKEKVDEMFLKFDKSSVN